MTSTLCIVEQVALYLGPPWKFDRTGEPSNWRYEITDGGGRALVFSHCYSSTGKFQISGAFPRSRTSPHRDDYKTIGVSITRPPRDIAADVSRRLIPHYLEAFDRAAANHQQEREWEQQIELIGQAIIKVTGGRFADTSRSSRRIYFDHGTAEIWTGERITLELSNLSPEMAIKIAAQVSAK